jgi:two-component sensor histidine kinase/CheY-like chemotaxis protein
MGDLVTLLLVEDQAVIALNEANNLRAEGYAVEIVHSGEAACERAERRKDIDLVLMDIDLGRGIDGTEAARRILRSRDVPIVFLTSHAEREMVERVRSITRYGYVLKSSGTAVLLSSIDMALRLFRATQERKRHERELREHAQFERLISELSSRFIQTPDERVDEEINAALERIGRFKGADRAYVFLFRDDEDGDTADNTHEWCAPGVRSERANLQGLGLSGSLPRFYRTIAEQRVYHVPDVEALPDEEGAERELFRAEDIRSLVVVPMTLGGRLFGFLGFDAVRERRFWTEEDRSLLKLVGEIVMHSLDRRMRNREMQHRVEMEQVLVEVSASFVGISPEELDSAIQNALGSIGRYAGLDRSYLFLFSSDGERMDNTHEWCAPGIEAHRENLQQLPIDHFPWLMSRLRKQESVHIPTVESLPSEAKNERYHLQQQHIRALVLVPLVMQGACAGFLGFDKVRTERSLSENDVALLRTVGEIIAAAMERLRVEGEVSSLLEQKEYLLREVHHRIKNDMHIIRSLLSLQAERVSGSAGREALEEASLRVGVMQEIYDKLYRGSDVRSVELGPFLRDLIADVQASYGQSSGIEMQLEVEEIDLPARAALSLGIVVNELVSNAFKYAFPQTHPGTVRITVERSRGSEEGREELHLAVRDDGVGPPEEILREAGYGFGLTLVDAFASQNGGRWRISDAGGSCMEVWFSMHASSMGPGA